jgi:acyl carrier protein
MQKINGNTATAKEISERIFTVISEVSGLDPEDLDPAMSITDDIAPSSIDRVTLFMALEDEFGASIPENEVRGITTLKELLDFVMDRVRQAHALST